MYEFFQHWIDVMSLKAAPTKTDALVILLVITWSLIWKGLALWKAAREESKPWFVVLLVVNTLGILEILYLYVFGVKKGTAAGEEGK